jgi:hypothetical protein
MTEKPGQGFFYRVCKNSIPADEQIHHQPQGKRPAKDHGQHLIDLQLISHKQGLHVLRAREMPGGHENGHNNDIPPCLSVEHMAQQGGKGHQEPRIGKQAYGVDIFC